MKLGVTLPTFSADGQAPLRAAALAEAAGLHGVFSFDHQWPLGHPERPSMSVYPTLGAVAASTTSIRVGTLVARIGLLPDEVVLTSLRGLKLILGDRLIAGLGTGDDASEPEHSRYGLPYFGADDRHERLRRAVERLAGDEAIETWVGGGGASTNEVVRQDGVSLNLWGASPQRVARMKERLGVPITWGGPVPRDHARAVAELRALQEAGATWVVWAWPSSLEAVRSAACEVGIALAGT